MNPRELDVLNILWKSKESMMVTDIVNAGEGLTQSTVTTVLRKLLQEKLVEVTGIKHSGKVLSRTYRPSEKSKEMLKKHFLNQYSMFMDVIKPSEMCAAIKNSSNDVGSTCAITVKKEDDFVV